ncbi:MAG: DUF2868 domain-containing protein [Proteobacteria bacterium]|nr:DUF2868 domain-containing protein [Pseudomonadota bacterium]MBU1687565.1 DUF2868 domain-containing protein [Pseudomonadota bacterium]
MKPLWRLEDIIDLEYLLLRDENLLEEEGQEALGQRDRDIYLQQIAQEGEGQEELPPTILLLRWLRARQQQEAEQANGIILPGRFWSELYQLSWWGLFLFGLLSGAGLAFSFLAYSGAEPVNVTVYLGLFVGTQFLLLGLMGVLSLLRLVQRRGLRESLLYNVLIGLMVRGMLMLNRFAGSKMSGRQRLRASSVKGVVLEKTRSHGALFLWPVLGLLQMMAIGFNLGVLGATVLKVISSDIAFGWQSTLQISQQMVFKLVLWIALPWSWVIPTTLAYPNLEHIEGSKMVLKEGIYHLATEDLVSWWPFLCLAVLCYGLLPRLLLLVFCLAGERYSLARQQFTGAAYGQLIRRLTSPLLSTQAPIPEHISQPGNLELPPREVYPSRLATSEGQRGLRTAVTLIPDELYGQCPLEALQVLVRERLGMMTSKTIRIGATDADDGVVVNLLGEQNRTEKIENIILLQEAWLPPIGEFFSLIMRLRGRLGATVPIFVALVGKPDVASIFTPAEQGDITIWRARIRAMGEPDLQALELVVAS